MTISAIQIHDRVWQIEIPFGDRALVAMYLLQGDTWAIVDSGTAFVPPDDQYAAVYSVVAEDVVTDILLTHGHFDHVGGVLGLRSMYPGASVRLHPADMELATSVQHQSSVMTDFATDWGLDEGVEASIAAGVRSGMAGAPIDEELAEGSMISLAGGMNLSVIHLPGHTMGSVGYYWEEQGLLFAGDAVQGWGSRVGSWPLYFYPREYANSLQRLSNLEINVLCLAHGYYFGSPRNATVLSGDLVDRMLEESAHVAEVIARAVDVGYGSDNRKSPDIARDIVWELLSIIPAKLDARSMLPVHAGMTLHAHGLV